MTAVETAPLVITEPGIYDISNESYHADPVPGGSLSSSTARRLLAPSCPAKVEWERANPVHKSAYDIGTVAHKLILGAGQEIVEVDADSWRSKAANAERDEARDRGAVALLSHELVACRQMADAVRRHPIAGPLLRFGTPERSIFWRDDETQIMRRAMYDWLPDIDGPGAPVAVDVKTCESASPASIAKSVVNFGYDCQAAWYLDGLAAGGWPAAAFVFVFVEKDPPHLVTVAQLDDEAHERGHRLNRQAIAKWVECRESGVWPAYSSDIETIGLPRWALAN